MKTIEPTVDFFKSKANVIDVSYSVQRVELESIVHERNNYFVLPKDEAITSFVKLCTINNLLH